MYNREQLNQRLVSLRANYQSAQVSLATAQEKLDQLLEENKLIEETKVAIEQARPLLSASSIKQLEALANTAIQSIFHMDGEVQWDIESKRFVLSKDGQLTDLVDSNGGGLNTVISFVFDLFLMVKQGCRRILIYDEAFTAVSDEYFPDFMQFLHQAIHDLNCDLLLVSHDVRIDPSMADTCYRIEDGKSIRVK